MQVLRERALQHSQRIAFICVAAQGKDGEANMAVRELIAEIDHPSVSTVRLHQQRQLARIIDNAHCRS